MVTRIPPWGPLLILVTSLVFITSLCTQYGHTAGTALQQRTGGQVCIHDYVHEKMPSLEAHAYLYDLPVVLPILLVLLKPDLSRIEWFSRLLLLSAAMVYLYRCLTTTATIFTATKKELPPAQQTEPITLKWQHYIFGHSFDHMFSGHVALLVLIILCLFGSGIVQANLFTTTVAAGYILAYGLFSTLSRSHYTVDVLCSIPIAVLSYILCTSGNIVQLVAAPKI